MRLKTEEEAASLEPRYQAQTLRKVTTLAQHLQERHQETLSAKQIEAIGAEVGLEPVFIQRALSQLTARSQVTPRKPAAVVPSQSKRLGKVWWASAWSLLPISLAIGSAIEIGRLSQALFFAALGIYLGVGYWLSGASDDVAAAPQGQVSRTDLIEALFALQRELDTQKEHRAFLSIDVVGSSEMKRSGDDLAVEYSFTQFHDWVERLVRACGGELQGVAGDGFMCVFEKDGGAVCAARQLQEGLAGFNTSNNRLPHPFRIRCGITAGEVAVAQGKPIGHLQSSVIDRAAILQKSAQPGDIVVGPEVATAALTELGGLAALPEPVQGEPAFSWLAGRRVS